MICEYQMKKQCGDRFNPHPNNPEIEQLAVRTQVTGFLLVTLTMDHANSVFVPDLYCRGLQQQYILGFFLSVILPEEELNSTGLALISYRYLQV